MRIFRDESEIVSIYRSSLEVFTMTHLNDLSKELERELLLQTGELLEIDHSGGNFPIAMFLDQHVSDVKFYIGKKSIHGSNNIICIKGSMHILNVDADFRIYYGSETNFVVFNDEDVTTFHQLNAEPLIDISTGIVAFEPDNDNTEPILNTYIGIGIELL